MHNQLAGDVVHSQSILGSRGDTRTAADSLGAGLRQKSASVAEYLAEEPDPDEDGKLRHWQWRLAVAAESQPSRILSISLVLLNGLLIGALTAAAES